MNETMNFKNLHVMAVVDMPLAGELSNSEFNTRIFAEILTKEINDKKEWSNVFNHFINNRENIKLILHGAISGSKDNEHLQDFARQSFQIEHPDIDQNAHTNFFIMGGTNKDGKYHSVMMYFLLE